MDKKNFSSPPFVIFILAFLLYSNTLFNRYAVDDAIVITENQYTEKGIAGIKDIFTHDTFDGFFKDRNTPIAGGRYRPLSVATFAVEMEFFGENPFVSHLGNVLLFSLVCVLVYFFVLLLFENNSENFFSVPFITALIFLVHPIHTEAVANIKGRDEIMVLLGCLAAAIFFLKYYDSGDKNFLLGGILFFFLGMMAKENAITFLAVIPMTIFFFRKIEKKKMIFLSFGILIPAVIFLFLRQKFANDIPVSDATNLLNNPFAQATVAQKFATIIYTHQKYLQLSFFPLQLTHDYNYNQVPLMKWVDVSVIVSLAVLSALLLITFSGLKKRAVYSFSILFYFITLLPMSNFFFPVGTNLSERFLFMPSMGICLLLAGLFSRFLSENKNQKLFSAAKIIGILVLVLASAKTFSRNLVWKDNITLFSTDIIFSYNSAKANFDFAAELGKFADSEKDSVKKFALLNDAEKLLNRAISILPSYAHAWLVLGNIEAVRKNFLKGIENYHIALIYYPDWADANINMASAFWNIQNHDSAIYYWEKALPVVNDNDIIFYRLGVAYGRHKNNLEKAIEYFNRSIFINPKNADAYQDLGVVYAMKKDFDNALYCFNKTLQLNPQNEKMFLNIANVYFAKGDTARAKQYLEKMK